MKAKYILLTAVLLGGCVPKSYTIEQSDAVYKQIGNAMTQQAGYINLLVQKVYAQSIKKCKDKGLGMDLKDESCVKNPEEKAKK